MTDEAKALVEKLYWLGVESAYQAADLIETQAREIERLREALEKYDRLKSGIVGARAALAGDSHD